MIKSKVISLGLCSRRESYGPSTAKMFAKPDYERLLEALSVCIAVPTSPVGVRAQSVDCSCKTAFCFVSCRPLDRYDALWPFLKAAIIPMEHRSHLLFQEADIVF